MEEKDNPKRQHTPDTDRDDPAQETMSPKQEKAERERERGKK